VRRRLRRVRRVWVTESNVPSPGRPPQLGGLPFRLVRTWQVSVSRLSLYEREYRA
jgi:hypothetical protein